METNTVNTTVNTNTLADLRWVGPIEATIQSPTPCKGEGCDCFGSQWVYTCDPTYRGHTALSWIMETTPNHYYTVSGRPIRLKHRGGKTFAWYGIEQRPSQLACQIRGVNPAATGLLPGEAGDGIDSRGNWCPVLRHPNGSVLRREYNYSKEQFDWVVTTHFPAGSRAHRLLVDEAWETWRRVVPSLPRHAAGAWY